MNTLTAIEEELQRLDLSCFQLEDKRMFRNLNCCFNGDFSDFEREQDKLSRTIENKLDQLSSIESSEISDLDQNGKLLVPARPDAREDGGGQGVVEPIQGTRKTLS